MRLDRHFQRGGHRLPPALQTLFDQSACGLAPSLHVRELASIHAALHGETVQPDGPTIPSALTGLILNNRQSIDELLGFAVGVHRIPYQLIAAQRILLMDVERHAEATALFDQVEVAAPGSWSVYRGGGSHSEPDLVQAYCSALLAASLAKVSLSDC